MLAVRRIGQDSGSHLGSMRTMPIDTFKPQPALQVVVLRANAQSVDSLKGEVQHLGRQLQNERAKANALSEELETPLNVHRCDPAADDFGQHAQYTADTQPLHAGQKEKGLCSL